MRWVCDDARKLPFCRSAQAAGTWAERGCARQLEVPLPAGHPQQVGLALMATEFEM